MALAESCDYMIARASNVPTLLKHDNILSNDTETNDLLWGADSIAFYIGRTKRQVFWLLENGSIPGRKAGNIWVSSKSALRERLAGDTRRGSNPLL